MLGRLGGGATVGSGEGDGGEPGCDDGGGELGSDVGPRDDITGAGEEECAEVGGCVGLGLLDEGLLAADGEEEPDDEGELEDEAEDFDVEELDEVLAEPSATAAADVGVGVGFGPSSA